MDRSCRRWASTIGTRTTLTNTTTTLVQCNRLLMHGLRDKGKPPSYKELTEEIGPTIIKQRAGAHWFSSNRAFFDQDLPEGWGDDLKAEAQRRGETPPTDQGALPRVCKKPTYRTLQR